MLAEQAIGIQGVAREAKWRATAAASWSCAITLSSWTPSTHSTTPA
jgi:hypothetical protein